MRLSAFPPDQRPQMKLVSDMMRMISGGLARSIQSGQSPAANPVPTLSNPTGPPPSSGTPTAQQGDLLYGLSSGAWSKLPIGADGQFLIVGGNAPLWSSTLSGTVNVEDAGFFIQDDADPTKQLQFQVSAIAAGATRTLTAQNASGTLPLLEAAQTWTGIQTFRDAAFKLVDEADPTKTAAFSLGGATANADLVLSWAGTVDRAIAFPDAAGTLALTSDIPTVDSARTWASLQTFKDTTFKLVDDADATKTAVLSLGGASPNADLTLAWAGTVDRTVTIPDNTGTLALTSDIPAIDQARTWATLQTFKDTTFKIVDDADSAKTLVFSLGDSVTGADLTLKWAGSGDSVVTLPNGTTTLAGLSLAQTWLGPQIFDAVNGYPPEVDINPTAGTDIYTFLRIVDASTGFGVNCMINSNISADADYIFPSAAGGGTLLPGNGTALTTFKMRSSSTTVGAAFAHTADTTKMLRFVLSGVATGTNNSITLTNTASRNYELGNLSGHIPIVGDDVPAVASGGLGMVDLTGQTAAIGSTNLSNTPPAGLYRVDVYAACTTASGSGTPTLDVNIAWTDVVGATNVNVVAGLALSATGRASGTQLIQLSSGNIAYTTTINAASGSPQYALYIRVTYLY